MRKHYSPSKEPIFKNIFLQFSDPQIELIYYKNQDDAQIQICKAFNVFYSIFMILHSIQNAIVYWSNEYNKQLVYSCWGQSLYYLFLFMMLLRVKPASAQVIKWITIVSNLGSYAYLQFIWMKIQHLKINNNINDEEPIFNSSLYAISVFSFLALIQPYLLSKWYQKAGLFLIYQIIFMVNSIANNVLLYFVF